MNQHARFSVGDQVDFKPHPGTRGWWKGKVAALLTGAYAVTNGAGQSYVVPFRRVRASEARPERPRRSLGPTVAKEGTRTVTTGRPSSRASRPKEPPQRSRDYLAFVRSHACAFGPEGCLGPVEAAHGPGPRGLGQKTDDLRCFPCCTGHHSELHTTGAVRSTRRSVGPDASMGVVDTTPLVVARAQVELLVEWLRRSV